MRTAPAADFMGCSGAARQEERHEQHGTQHDRRLAHQRAAVQHAEQRREPEPEPGPSRRRLAEQLAHASQIRMRLCSASVAAATIGRSQRHVRCSAKHAVDAASA
jgi:hypothetical protein